MKTAEEIFRSVQENLKSNHYLIPDDFMLQAMKEYAEQAIDKAAERTNYPYRDEFGCVCNVPYIVLSVKEELK